MSLGLPSFSMIFSGKAVSAIERSARGIVAMILTDGTEGGKDLNIYKKVDEVDFQNWTEQNYNYLTLVFRLLSLQSAEQKMQKGTMLNLRS